MGFRQAFNIQFRICPICVRSGIQVDIVGTVQFSIYFHAVIAGNPVIHFGDQSALRSGGIGFRCHIHLNVIAAAEGNVAAIFKSALLFQFRPCIDSYLISRGNKIIAIHIYVFGYTSTLSFYLVRVINICIGIVNLAVDSSHFDIFANVHTGFAGHDLS